MKNYNHTVPFSTLRHLVFLVTLSLVQISVANAQSSIIGEWKGLPQLLERMKHEDVVMPSIYSKKYILGSPIGEQKNLSHDAEIGKQLYADLNSYSGRLYALPIGGFSSSLDELSVLRDALWRNGRFGDLILARQINNVIFWNIARRIAFGDYSELELLSGLLKEYKFLPSNANVIVSAVNVEWGTKYKPVNSFENFKTFCQSLVMEKGGDIYYMGHPKFLDFVDNYENDVVLNTLSTISIDPSREKTLKFFLELRRQVKKFPEKVGDTIELSPPGAIMPVVTTTTSRDFRLWVPKYIPDSLQQRELGSPILIKPINFIQLWKHCLWNEKDDFESLYY